MPPKKEPLESEPNAAFNWFPGHMMKALRDIKAKVAMVDLVIEIRDARLPLVSGNRSLTESIAGKSRLILLNKANLADAQMNQRWAEWFEQRGESFLFINCLEKSSVKEVISKAKRLIEKKRRDCNEDISAKRKYKFMVMGLPNTGKSTFINSIAQRSATKVADKPGQTREQIWVKVDDEIDLLDTPGVMPPSIDSEEHKLWLVLINAIPDSIVNEEDPVCYLVNHFLKHQTREFKERYKLESLDMGLEETLTKIALVRGCIKQKGLPDFERVYKHIMADFRAGLLGKITFSTP